MNVARKYFNGVVNHDPCSGDDTIIGGNLLKP